ncbi:hypothetical protein [Streptomyces montanus]|nr:hypothetical protein [Streptomyces montanus]
MLFSSWGELQDYAAYDPADRDLQARTSIGWSPFSMMTACPGKSSMSR